MSQDRYQRVAGIFRAACELDAAQREAYLVRECGEDEALRAEVLELLDHDERPYPGLSVSDARRGQVIHDALRDADVVDEDGEAPPERIGPYELREKIGSGGMGEVYAADQLRPVQRRVALKLIKRGMDSAQVVARFEAERQALARMSHPNVAQVFDGGTADDGRPYFVMELVDGEPITDACDREELSTRERVELFLGVCEGIQHAHQKGLVHRDLKPSNLLVTQQDGRSSPKIIDFGVARAVTGRLGERTLQTMMGQVVGTLDYMSPEQADPTGVDVDTRSDIYSLGVVLYQLVSGLLPFDFSTATDVPLSDVQRAIREQEPPTPSTRLRRQTATATSIATRRGTDERSLVRQLHGDLDWICMKALEKDPDRRYASASELADDLRRYLAHEPVLAARPDALYRTRKFVRRNRVTVTAGVLVTVGLGLGVVGIVSGRIEAETNAVRAEAERANVLRLSASVKLLELQALPEEVDALWPVTLERVADYEAWLRRADVLVASLDPAPDGSHPGHRGQLEELRAQALPRTGDERQAERMAHPRYTELQAKTEEITEAQAGIEVAREQLGPEPTPEQASVLEAADAKVEAAVRERDALESVVDERRVFTYRTVEDALWDQQLETLVEGVAEMQDPETGLIVGSGLHPQHGWSITRRRDFAHTLAERSLASATARERWSEAIASIADRDECPAYEGWSLAPQLGLAPLGRDPDSGLWEFAHLMSGEPAVRDPVTGRLVTDAETGLVLVLLPGGTLFVGAQAKDPGLDNYHELLGSADAKLEGPVFHWSVDPFFSSKFEMTQGQWERFVGWNRSPRDMLTVEDARTYPVASVSLTDCKQATYRLGLTMPSEEQWEYAARAGTDTPWWTGSDEASLEGAANLSDLSLAEERPATVTAGQSETGVPWSDGYGGTSPVGTFRANAFGLHDVHGNIGEWCFTHRMVYRMKRRAEPRPYWGVVRGGICTNGSNSARVSFRGYNNQADFSHGGSGLRPIRVVDGP